MSVRRTFKPAVFAVFAIFSLLSALLFSSALAPAGAQGDTPTCDGRAVTVQLSAGEEPTAGDDVILGTPGADTINAGAGNDLICALGGNDTIDGGDGDDIIFGGNGNDRINGGLGKDRIRGQNGNDTINGGAGNDNLNGNNGDDKVNGGDGTDYVSGRDGRDVLTGGPGNDTLRGGGKSDVMRGGPGNDNMNGNSFADDMFGGTGNDIMVGGDGPDHLRGETGNDDLSGSRGADTLWGGSGTDSCDGMTGVDTAVSCETEANIENGEAQPPRTNPSIRPPGDWETWTVLAKPGVVEIDTYNAPNGSPVQVVFQYPNGTNITYPLLNPTVFNQQLALLVTTGNPGDEWVEVLLPVRPQGSTAWVKAAQFDFSSVNEFYVEVDLGTSTLRAWERDELLLETAVTTGRSDTPTPTFSSYIDELVPNTFTPYPGDWIVSLGAFAGLQEQYRSSGLAKIAILGTEEQILPGVNTTIGSIRVSVPDLAAIAEAIPVGTRVDVVNSGS